MRRPFLLLATLLVVGGCRERAVETALPPGAVAVPQQGPVGLSPREVETSVVEPSPSAGPPPSASSPDCVPSPSRDVVNVRDFGAAGDGVTDDSEAIAAAGHVAFLSGRDLVFPEGVYLGSAHLDFTGQVGATSRRTRVRGSRG